MIHHAHDETPTKSVECLSPSLDAYQKTLLGRTDRTLLSGKPARVLLAVLLAGVLIAPSVQFVIRIQEVDASLWRAGGQRHRTALGRWLPTAAELAKGQAGQNPYGDGHWFPTPPLVLMSLVPLSKMGYASAAVVWAALKVLGLVGAMALLIRRLGRADFAIPIGVLVLAAVFSLRPVVSDLQHGNLNIFMLIWLALAWAMYVRGQDVAAGLFVALAIVTKVTPALVLVYFIYKRAWRVCLGALVGLPIVFLLLPGLYLGFERNLTLLHTWYEMLIAPFARDGYATVEIANQSLYGVLIRLLSNAGVLALEEMPADQALRVGMDAIMARPVSALGDLLRPAVSLSVVAVLGWVCRAKCSSRRDPRLLLEFGLVLLAMLLLSERTWKHHATTLPIVYLGVWYALTCLPTSDRFRAWYVAGLIGQFALLAASGEGLLGDDLAERLLDGGVFCWGLVLCFVQVAILLRRLGIVSQNAPFLE